MQIDIINAPARGVPVGSLEFGTVVTRAENEQYYLVASRMDGTGDRVLITLASGTLKAVPQDTQVIPVNAIVRIHGAAKHIPFAAHARREF